MPVYLLTAKTGQAEVRIVEAKSQAGANNHVTKDLYSIVSLSASDVVAHMQAGEVVEKAGVVDEVETTETTEAPSEINLQEMAGYNRAM